MAVNETHSTCDDTLETQRKQRLRIKRLGMSLASQGITLLMVLFSWHQGNTPLFVVRDFVIATLILNAAFLFMFCSGWNLKLKEQSFTGVQMVTTLFPAAWVVYFLEDGQARASILFIAMVSALYGIFTLNTRRFLKITGCYLLVYAVLISLLWRNKPELISPPLELMQAFTFTLVMTQIAVLGGYINRVRKKLSLKNTELKDTMEELKEAVDRIKVLANTDELTGINNRRCVLKSLANEVNRYSRNHGPFSVAMLDLDLFKSINDSFGHQAGDVVLKSVASTVKDGLRSIDTFGRYGGEEFLLIMPQTTLEGAATKAERIRKSIQALTFPEITATLKITVSIGIAQHLAGEAADETLVRADKALFKAKADGRNRIVLDVKTTNT